MKNDSNIDFNNTRKGGYHGKAWERTEETPGRKESQQRRSRQKQHQKKETEQLADDRNQPRKEADQDLEGKKGKETGYDDPHSDNDGEGLDKHGNET